VALGARLAHELPSRAVVLLIGNLGAGKTMLAKGIVSGLGAAPPDEVSSPTFTLIHEYGAAAGATPEAQLAGESACPTSHDQHPAEYCASSTTSQEHCGAGASACQPPGAPPPAPRVYHIDLYRLEEAREAATLGLDEIFERDAIVLIEWGERFPQLMPAARTEIHLRDLGGDEREIEVTTLPSNQLP
jgi:tRNA threonylcarbamoyladenosine biosynthesis protein TsaE